MNNDNYLQQAELDVLREQVNAPPHQTSEMDDVNAIESLTATRQKIEKVFDDLAASLQARLTLLNEAIKPTKSKAKRARSKKIRANVARLLSAVVCCQWSAVLLPTLCIGIFCVGIAAGVLFIAKVNDPVRPQIDVVRPVTETLEEFAARESEALTADERRKLIVVTEKILNEDFTTPSAMRETFYHERLLAGVGSRAFNDFSEKWAVRAEGKNLELGDSVETMGLIYGSLLRGLKVQAYNDVFEMSEDKSQEIEENDEQSTPSNSSLQTSNSLPDSSHTTQRPRIFRRR